MKSSHYPAQTFTLFDVPGNGHRFVVADAFGRSVFVSTKRTEDSILVTVAIGMNAALIASDSRVFSGFVTFMFAPGLNWMFAETQESTQRQ